MFKSLAVATIASTAFAQAALATPITPESAAEMLLASGSEAAEVNWLEEDVARIDGQLGDYFYSVRFMDCTYYGACGSVMVFATFAMSGAPTLQDYQTINAYNDSYPFGRAFILEKTGEDEYTVGVDYTIDVSEESDFNASDMSMFNEILSGFTLHMSSPNE